MTTLDPDGLSALIGSIYDCAIDPDLWPATMGRICGELGGYSAGIMVLDFDADEPGGAGDRLVRDWGPPSDWDAKLADVFTSVKLIHRPFLGRTASQLDEPIVLPRDSALAAQHYNEPAHRSWAEPQGIHQVMESVALTEPRRLGLFSITRQVTRGEFTDDDIALLRRLAPHIRRAITISDLLDVKRLEAQALKAALDLLTSGVVIVGENARILHANQAAAEIMTRAGPLGERRGLLTCREPRQGQELLRAIAQARSDEATLGGQGIAVALHGDRGPVVATVLPLARGDIRTRLVPSATAAVFVNPGRPLGAFQVQSFGHAYGLTAAEAKVLAELVLGRTIAEAGETLGIAESTAKTHLRRVFAKTETARQSDLIALVARTVPPVRG